MKTTGNTMGNQRQSAGFAISDILELDRNSSQEIDPISSETSMYSTQDLSHLPRYWPLFPDNGKYLIITIEEFSFFFA